MSVSRSSSAVRLLLAAVVIIFGAYWAGGRWGARQTVNVQALPLGETKPAGLSPSLAQRDAALTDDESINVRIYRQTAPAVANVLTKATQYDFFMDPVPVEGAGSGFIIDKRGYILTNFHVVQEAQSIEVVLGDQSRYPAKFIGADQRNDVALLKIEPNGKNLATLPLGDSGNLQVGQKVLAIGNPFGFQSTLTTGVVSALGRTVQTSETTFIDEAIQTDAAINPGNSGGPLMNWHGEVIGINTMILSSVGQSSGVGFAIPINTAKAVLNDLMTLGRVRRPALGVRTIPIGPELADELALPIDYGLLIVQVTPGGSADLAGLRGGTDRAYLGNIPITLGGDLIIAIDGEKVQDEQDLSQMMDNHRAGDTVKVTIYRNKKKMDVSVALGEARQQV